MHKYCKNCIKEKDCGSEPKKINGFWKCIYKDTGKAKPKKKLESKSKIKKKSLKPLPKLLRETQVLVNKQARDRDKKCLRCGNETSLQAHHYILAQGSSSKHRFNLENLITLCYGCHIHYVHKHCTVQVIDEIRQIALNNKITTPERLEEIKLDRESKKWLRYELEEFKEGLKNDNTK